MVWLSLYLVGSVEAIVAYVAAAMPAMGILSGMKCLTVWLSLAKV